MSEIVQKGFSLAPGVDTQTFPVRGPLVEITDQGFKVVQGLGSIPLETLAKYYDLYHNRLDTPRVEMSVDEEALQKWVDLLIDDAFSAVGINLVRKLGLYPDPNGKNILTPSIILTHLTNQPNRYVQLNAITPEGKIRIRAIKVVDLFQGDFAACQYTIFTGLRMAAWEKLTEEGNDPRFQDSIFQSLMSKSLNTERILQHVHNSPQLFEWAYPNDGPQNLIQSVEALIYNAAIRETYLPLIQIANKMLTNLILFNHLADENLILAGKPTYNDDATYNFSDHEFQSIINSLKNKALFLLYFRMDLMDPASHRYLVEYLYYRFGEEAPGKKWETN
ncbi:MAG TPA: hypothetical protein VD999_07180 [Vitreimonas sp.]|nr:hypothetical protein [Vitreimonas sp.]